MESLRKKRYVLNVCVCTCVHVCAHTWKHHEDFLYSLGNGHRGKKEVGLSKIINKLHLSHTIQPVLGISPSSLPVFLSCICKATRDLVFLNER